MGGVALTAWLGSTCYSVFMSEAAHVHFTRHRLPAEIVAHAVWLYYRFPLSLCDVEDLLAERGITVTFQTVSEWATKFGPKFAHERLIGSAAELSHNPGKFQLPLAQNRGHVRSGASGDAPGFHLQILVDLTE